MAGWMAVLGSAFLLLTLFDLMSQMRSIEMREGIEEFLSTPPGDGLGLTVEGTIDILRALTLVAGAASAAALVLAIYVLQRNNAARLGFTIAAVPIALTAPLSGGFLAVVVVFSASMLWTKPARDWFAGRSPAQSGARQNRVNMSSGPSEDRPAVRKPSEGDDTSPSSRADDPDASSTPGQEWPRMPDPNTSSERPGPPPTQGFGSPTPPSHEGGHGSQQYPPQYPQQSPQGTGSYPQQGQGGSYPQQDQGQGSYTQGQSWPPPAYGQQPQQYSSGGQDWGQQGGQQGGPQRDAEKRPSTVTTAGVLTWVFSGLTAALYLVIVLMLVVAKDQLLTALEQEPALAQMDIDGDTVVAALWVMSAILILWCFSAAVLAFLAMRRLNWARYALVVSAAFTAILSLLAIGSLVSALPLIAAVAVIVLLFTGGANQWYSRKSGGDQYPYYPQQPQQQYGAHGQQGQGQYDDQSGQQGQGQHGDQSGQQDERKDPPKNVW